MKTIDVTNVWLWTLALCLASVGPQLGISVNAEGYVSGFCKGADIVQVI